jgi:hypothetical protein
MLGSLASQGGWLALGCGVVMVLTEMRMPTIPVLLSLFLLARGAYKGLAILRLLQHGKISAAKVLKVQKDISGDTAQFNVVLETKRDSGESLTFQVSRIRDDLVVGDTIPMLLDEGNGIGIMEKDLPARLSFPNVFGQDRIPGKCLIRVLVVPVLSLSLLCGFIPKVSELASATPVIEGYPVLYACPVVIQVLWLISNAKYFTWSEINLAQYSSC